MKLLSTLVILLASATSFAKTATEQGLFLKAGDQTLVRSVPVSCEAPLPTKAKYTFYCDDSRLHGLSIYIFIDSATANDQAISERRNDIIIARGINPNDCVMTPGWQGPFDLTHQFTGSMFKTANIFEIDK